MAASTTSQPDGAQPWTRRDLGIAACVFFAAAIGGVTVTRASTAAGYIPQFYQGEFGPAVMAACGQGFRNPPTHSGLPELSVLRAFLEQRTDWFDCASLPRQIGATPLTGFQLESPHLIRFAGWIWRFTGVSWPMLAWLGGILTGMSAAAVYLFFRGGMGPVLAVFVTLLWATSPLHLSQVPHLRDYSKAPFFAVMLCAIVWAARATTNRVVTVFTMGCLGVFFGLGFGFRTDVAIYLPVVIVALLFRSPWSWQALVTTSLASIVALVMFLVVAAPVFRGYQSGNNFAHWALLGLTDPSREALHLNRASYSFGYLYHDVYVTSIIGAEAERQQPRQSPVLLRSPDYAYWGNEYYSRLLSIFPGDMLTRSWAAVNGVLGLPFIPMQVERPSWSSGIAGRIFDWRGSIVAGIATVPPVATMVGALALLSAVSLRSALLAGGLCAMLAGVTAIQFQQRHIFQLEVFSWFATGFLLTALWQSARDRFSRVTPRLLRRAAIASAVIALLVLLPIAAARWYQSRQVTKLFAAFESAPADALDLNATVIANGQAVLNRITQEPAWHEDRFTDSDLIVAAFGGEQCDEDVIDVTFRFASNAPYPDLTRAWQVPMPPPGPQRTRLLFPVYTSGGRSADPSASTFTGIELSKADQSCLADVRRVTRPEALPVFMEALLTPDWRSRRLYETFKNVEPAWEYWRSNDYSVPIGLNPGRRWLSRIEPIRSIPTYRSPQVKMLDHDRIESRGRSARPGAYLLSWPYETRRSGSALFVEGELRRGGLTVGLQQDESWVRQLNVDAIGKFRTVIRVDADGAYGVIIANHQVDGGSHNSIITRLGWLPTEND